MTFMLLLVLTVRSFKRSFSIMDAFFCGWNEDGLIEFTSLFKLVALSTERLLARRWFKKDLEINEMNAILDLKFS